MKYKLRDGLQSLLLIFLSLSAAILLFMLWYTPPEENDIFAQWSDEYSNSHLEQYIAVKSILFTRAEAKEIYYYDTNSIFKNRAKAIGEAFLNSEEITQIEPADYQTIKQDDFIEIEFSTAYDSEQFVSLLNSQNCPLQFPFKKVETLLFRLNDENNIYIKSNNEYYQLTGQGFDIYSKADLDSVNKKEIAKEYQGFYLPEQALADFTMIDTAPDFDFDDQRAINILARKIFVSQLDFVQKMIDVNGAKLMIYGYGDKALRITPEGQIYYAQKIDTKVNPKLDFVKDLSLAISVIKKFSTDQKDISLAAVSRLRENNLSGFKFSFYYTVNKYNVRNPQSQSSIEVEIMAGQLRSIAMAVMDSKAVRLRTADDSVENIIEKNQLQGIIACHAIYVEGNGVLIPAYCLESDQFRYYYNAVDANLIFRESK